jgi:hypothetical protein
MIERIGNLFGHVASYDIIVIPCCGRIRSDCSLVMGAGAAKASVRAGLWGLVERDLGTSIVRTPHAYSIDGQHYTYGFCLNEMDYSVAALQTKVDPFLPSTLGMVEFGVAIMLSELGEQVRVGMFYPGIGLGGLAHEDVRELLHLMLPNNYEVWRKR